MFPYHFQGYWRDVGTIGSYWDANMDMLSPEQFDLYDKAWPIRAHSPISVPQYIGESAEIGHSIITEGCVVEGEVENSILSNSVKVGKGAKVRYSILMQGAEVGEGADIEYAIVGENTKVGAGACVGEVPSGKAGWGIATVGPDITIGAGCKVEAGAMIYDSVEASK